MGSLTTRQIRDRAIQIIRATPGGTNFKSIVAQIVRESPDTNENTIKTQIAELPKSNPDEIIRASRGVYAPLITPTSPPETPKPRSIGESEFYESFAEWLKQELDEATEASALGGASLRDKWGTPDVVGVYKASKWDIVKFEPEIISAEVKVDTSQAVVAFGQAVAYRLFSAKSYIVMPEDMSEVDLSRLESLCMLFGVGLVLFRLDTKRPDFQIRVRAQRVPPDMFYVNEFAERLKNSNREIFESLFS